MRELTHIPDGKVHKALREILYPDLTDSEKDAVIVCLLCHLLVENQINLKPAVT